MQKSNHEANSIELTKEIDQNTEASRKHGYSTILKLIYGELLACPWEGLEL